MTHSPAPPGWPEQARALIRRRYAHLAAADSFHPDPRTTAVANGCPADWYDALPPRAAGTYSGCGWPAAGLTVQDGQTIVDLGCGGGLDARYIAEQIGPNGRVIALDLTPDILLRARETIADAQRGAVQLLAADMECLPLDENCADAIVANASLNLATDKAAALAEIARILKPDRPFLAADLVRVEELPREIRNDPMAMATSLGGVLPEQDLRTLFEDAGFEDVRISGHRLFGPVVAVDIEARNRPG